MRLGGKNEFLSEAINTELVIQITSIVALNAPVNDCAGECGGVVVEH